MGAVRGVEVVGRKRGVHGVGVVRGVEVVVVRVLEVARAVVVAEGVGV